MSDKCDKIDKFFNNERVYLHTVLPLDTPFSINIEVSSICNIKCKYCIHSLEKEKLNRVQNLNVMSMDLFVKIIDQLKKFPKKIKTLCINGVGEPLCNNKFVEMLEYAKKSNVSEKIEFFTNGILLNNDLADRISNANIDRVKISLQGLSTNKYKEVCGKDIEYSKLYNQIKYFATVKGSCELFVKIIDIGLDGDYDKFIKEYETIADKIYVENTVEMFNEIDYKDIIYRTDIKTKNKYGINFIINKICPLPFYRMYIDVDGDVSFCYTIRNPVERENIKEKSLQDIWNGEKHNKFLIQMLKETKDFNKVCRDCNLMGDTAFSKYDNIDNFSDEILNKLENK